MLSLPGLWTEEIWEVLRDAVKTDCLGDDGNFIEGKQC